MQSDQDVANPLCEPLRKALLNGPVERSEHELLTELEPWMPAFVAAENDVDRRLFLRHFLLMNALYRLEPALLEQGWRLEIHAIRIRLIPVSAATGKLSCLGSSDALRVYYLDLNELRSMAGDDVRELLSLFWQRYLAHQQQDDSLTVLGASPGENWPSIQQRYRKLAQTHHPDRGGKAEEFQRIREAYEALKHSYGA